MKEAVKAWLFRIITKPNSKSCQLNEVDYCCSENMMDQFIQTVLQHGCRLQVSCSNEENNNKNKSLE